MKDEKNDEVVGSTEENPSCQPHEDTVDGAYYQETLEEPLSLPTEKDPTISNAAPSSLHTLPQMYRTWFLDYASYVILERAVPHIEDGLKPVQRRILHAMHLFENGHLHKVAKIVGQTMAFHPHGDASINDALVQLGQKGFLIDTQGNWGNIFTGDDAAAGRYIEAKLSPLALEVLFDNKLTEWKKSYDGTAEEPVALPIRFPLLLAQGAEGIAVGLSSRIYPHNPKELIESAIAYLQGKSFELYPDFPTGGLLDVERYNDGHRGGALKCRAKIEKRDDRLLSITELPFGKTTASLIDSIIKANEKGSIKIKHIDDMTAATVDIRIQLPMGVSTDKTIDGLYAFTDCEVSLSPNACVIKEGTPVFWGVSDLLRYSVDQTRSLLGAQLNYKLNEIQDALVAASLERIFIEQRIYKEQPFEEASTEVDALLYVKDRIEAMEGLSWSRPLMDDDFKRLLELRMARILRFNIEKHEERIALLSREAETISKNLKNLTTYTIKYYEHLLKEYGAQWERKTTLTRFGAIEASQVIEATEKFYFDREGNFAGTGLKNADFVADCSSLDDFIVIFRNGSFRISKIEDKKFLGKGEVIYINRFKRNDTRTIYNIVYRHGKRGPYYMKRCYISGIVRDKDYFLTKEEEGSRVMYISVNPNGEAETIHVALKSQLKMHFLTFDKDFSIEPIRARGVRGSLVTKAEVQRVSLKQRGASTLGGRKVWFDRDVMRINYNEQGEYLGEFEAQDALLVLTQSGTLYTTDISESNHFEEEVIRVEKLDPHKVWSVVYYDSQQHYFYLKRFDVANPCKPQSMQGAGNLLIAYSDNPLARFAIHFGGRDKDRPIEEVDAATFIDVKSIRAKGKRLTTREVLRIEEISVPQMVEQEKEEIENLLVAPQEEVQQPLQTKDLEEPEGSLAPHNSLFPNDETL